MLNFNYTLDNELKAPVGQLPSGIQVQAFGMAATRMSQKFTNAVRLLKQPVPGLNKGPIAGLSPFWQARLKAEMKFLGGMPDRLLQVAHQVVTRGAGNAAVQGRLDQRWDRWSRVALTVYGEALDAFQKEVELAMANSPVKGSPAALVKLAALAKVPAPMVNAVKSAGMGQFDPAYFAGVKGYDDYLYMSGLSAYDEQMYTGELSQNGTPLLFGALAGASLVGLAAWYFTRGAGATVPTGVGYYW